MELAILSKAAVAAARAQFGNAWKAERLSVVGSVVAAAKQRLVKKALWTLECM
jgi:hypothetical protein